VSTSPTFKYRGPDKRCPFPFGRDAAFDQGGDYVTLTASGGDEGLAEACRIWWLLESVTLTPTGSVTFTQIFSPYTAITTTFAGDLAFVSYGAPVERISSANVIAYDGAPITGTATNGYSEGQIYLTLGYVGGSWRLYYIIYITLFNGSPGTETAFGGITDPFNGGGGTTGTFSLLGYTLSYLQFLGSQDGYNVTTSGLGLSATSTSYTLV